MPGLAAVAVAGVAGWVLRGGVANAGAGAGAGSTADDTEEGESRAAGVGGALAASANDCSGPVGASKGEGEGEVAGVGAGTGASANVAVRRSRNETNGSDGAGEGATRTPGAPVRVYMDGCFDCMHFGHANALRQAAALGDELVVGINPEAEIRVHKGPPVMSDWERRVAVEGVKWVDEILEGVPYAVTPEFLKELIDVHRIDFIVHGDDPCIGADGEDVYKAVKAMGKFRTIKRTEGVSSTDIVGRMLLCTRDHHVLPDGEGEGDRADDNNGNSAGVRESDGETGGVDGGGRSDGGVRPGTSFTRESTFLPTTRRLVQFAGTPRAPAPGDRVVYVDGTWDMFHAGHIETLHAARAKGDFLLVGIHDDATANKVKGGNFPIMNLHERTLSVLSCKHVDEVIIGAPWCVTEDMITTMNIAVVVHGTHRDPRDDHAPLDDSYAVPKRLEIYEEIQSSSELTVPVILRRIVNNRDAYLERNAKKEKSEADYLTNHKTYVPEG